VQAAIGQRELLMDCKKPHCHTCDAELEYDKESGAIRKCYMHQRIRLTPAIFQVEQSQKGIQDGAHADQDREIPNMPRQTIDISIASLPSPPKAFSPALPSYRTHECRGSRTSIGQATPFERRFVPCVFHICRFMPEVIHVRREKTIVALRYSKSI
jgi:hypothetical protein